MKTMQLILAALWKKIGNSKKGSKTSRILTTKTNILLRSLLQPLIYFIYFYEGIFSGEPAQMLAPVMCFLVSGGVNVSLILVGQSHIVFISVQTILMCGSLLLSILAKDSLTELDDSQTHMKMILTMFYFTAMLIAKIDLERNLEKGALFVYLVSIAGCYQILFYREFYDLCAMVLFVIFGSYSVWGYQRVLDALGGYHSSLARAQQQEILTDQLLQMKVYQDLLKDAINDGVFFAQLEESTGNVPKLCFYEKNQKISSIFDLRFGLEGILDKMFVEKAETIIYLQKKIFKLINDPDSSFDDVLMRIATSKVASINNASSYNENNPLNYNANSYLNSSHQSKQPFFSKKSRSEQDKIRSFHVLGMEDFVWNLKQLIIFAKFIRDSMQKDPTFDQNKAVKHQLVSHFSLMEIIFIQFFLIHRSQRKRSEQPTTAVKKDEQVSLLMKDIEVRYLFSLYQIQIMRCVFKKKQSIFVSITRTQNNNTFRNPSDTTDNTNSEEMLRFFQFFKNRSEKISKTITSSLCRADCMRENLEQGQKKELPQGNENITTVQTKQAFQSLVNSVTNNLEYMRMIMKDTEEYRELLEEQTRFTPQDSRLSRDDLRVRHKNLSRFRFSQLIEEIKKIFDLEVSFKSTYITVLEERYWKGKESVLPRATKNEINQSSVKSSVSLAEEEDESGVLYSDYEKLKRVLILLIENSLSYQKAGLIEIEVTEERYNVLRVKIIDNQYMKLSDEELKNINLKGSSDRGFGFAIITALLSAIKPQSVRGMALEIRKDSTNEKSNIVFWISKCLKDDSSNNNLNITTLGNISNNLHAEGGDKRKTDQSGFINGSLQQKAIDNLIDIQTKQLGDHNDANFGLPPQKSIPQFGQYKGVSQQQITSHLLLQPGKNKQPIAAFQLKLRQALINISAPSSFMDYYSAKAPDITSVISPKSYQGGGSLWNGIMTGKNKLQQEQQQQPLFLIVSDDFRTSASIHALLMKMCNNSENGVKFASNKTNLSDLLSKNIFEYIFIEELEGVNLTDIFIDINKNYKHRKQLQKVIFFDFHSQVQKNLEASIPLLESREINKEDAKSEFSLKLPFFPYPQNLRLGQQIKGESVKDSPHSGLSNNLSQLHQMNQGNLEIDDVVPQMMIQDDGDEDIEDNEKYGRREEEEEETNHEKSSSRRSNSSSSSSQSKRSIPSENFANKKVKHFTLPDSSRSPKKQHKHKGQIKRPINDLEDEDIGRNSSQVDIPSTGRSTSRTNLQLLMRSNRHGNNNNIILHHRQSLTQLQDIPQDISGDNSMLLNNSTLVLKNSKVTKIQDRPPTSFSSRNFSRSFSEALQDPKKKQKLFGVPALKAQETIAQPHLAVGSETELNKVSDNSPHSTHTRSSYGHFSPSKNNNQTVSQNALRKSQYFRQEGAPNNTKTFIKNDDNLPTNFINNNTISQNQLRKYSNNTQHDTPQHNNGRSQDNIKYSFDPKYNESIEVASSLKFAYFSLEYPFGYAQIYEAICHMNFTNDLLTLNQNFFNLNRPELYNSRQYF